MKCADIINVKFFDTLEALQTLTVLNEPKDLWAAGFDLDDWDWGFVSDEPWEESGEAEDDDGNTYKCDVPRFDKYYMQFILNNVDNRYCGYKHTEYKSKHYYLIHHS
jgi:hypothetical protein